MDAEECKFPDEPVAHLGPLVWREAGPVVLTSHPAEGLGQRCGDFLDWSNHKELLSPNITVYIFRTSKIGHCVFQNWPPSSEIGQCPPALWEQIGTLEQI